MHQKWTLDIMGGQKSGQGHQSSSSVTFQKVYFWVPMHMKNILNIVECQNQVKVTKGHEMQIFKKCIFEIN